MMCSKAWFGGASRVLLAACVAGVLLVGCNDKGKTNASGQAKPAVNDDAKPAVNDDTKPAAEPAATQPATTGPSADAGAGDYPLTTCIMSGKDLHAMGTPVNYTHEGRLVRFCCEKCRKSFQNDPAAHLAKLDEAIAAKSAAGTSTQ